jgi:hypothetical protein
MAMKHLDGLIDGVRAIAIIFLSVMKIDCFVDIMEGVIKKGSLA